MSSRRQVAPAASGVLGASGYTPDASQLELNWSDAHVGGKPYEVDVLVPEHVASVKKISRQSMDGATLNHREFASKVISEHGIPANAEDLLPEHAPSLSVEMGEPLMDVAFQHQIRLIASALGIAPPSMIGRARCHQVAVAALVGAKEHAVRQVRAGVDIFVAQGSEAGGHCGDVSTMVLVPEVVRAVRQIADVPVLAAGGIMTGGQMAGCMAMGAAGVWTGSVWLGTAESEMSPGMRTKLIAATSRDTVRSRARTGKPARQLRSAWHDRWDSPASPGCLPMPLMSTISQPAFRLIERAVARRELGAAALDSYFVGQGVGLLDSVQSAEAVVADFICEFADAVQSLQEMADG